jgi:hypothetical protein
MDLRHYYAKIRQTEAALESDFVVLVSQETADGGRAGIMSEAPRALAAKLIVDRRARLASEEEHRAFEASCSQARKLAEQATAAKRVQVTVLSESEARSLRRKE